MTFIGKILIVVILIMSVLFMGLSLSIYMTQTNWKDKAGELQTDLTTRQDEIKQLQRDIEERRNKAEIEKAARTAAVGALEQRANQAEQLLLAKQEEFQNLQSEHSAAIQTVATYQENIRQLKDEVASLRENIRIAQQSRDEQFELVKKYTNDIHVQEGMLRTLKEQREQLLNSLADAELVLARNGLSKDTPVDGTPPVVRGEVTAVRGTDLVEISLGSDEGLRSGHRLHVYRLDGSLLASVIVTNTNTDRSVARIIPETRTGNIRKGDRVATKI